MGTGIKTKKSLPRSIGGTRSRATCEGMRGFPENSGARGGQSCVFGSMSYLRIQTDASPGFRGWPSRVVLDKKIHLFLQAC